MGQSYLPHERFNLYHIDNLEIHLESLTVSAFLHDIDPTKPPTKESDQKLRKHFLAIKWGFYISIRDLWYSTKTQRKLCQTLQKSDLILSLTSNESPETN